MFHGLVSPVLALVCANEETLPQSVGTVYLLLTINHEFAIVFFALTASAS